MLPIVWTGVLASWLCFTSTNALQASIEDSDDGSAVLAGRQVTRSKLLERIAARSKMGTRGALKPRASVAPFPKCSVASTAGYARFEGYDYQGGSGNANVQSEGACLDFCRTQTTDCNGVIYVSSTAWTASRCWYKGSTFEYDLIVPAASNVLPAALMLKGSCSDFYGHLDNTAMNACCDTVDAYPYCNDPSLNRGVAYAHFNQTNLLGHDAAQSTTSNEGACIDTCIANAGDGPHQCGGVSWWPVNNQMNCWQKSRPFDNSLLSTTQFTAVSPGAALDWQGTCNILQGGGASLAAGCCNTM